jgi:hypothetical protein
VRARPSGRIVAVGGSPLDADYIVTSEVIVPAGKLVAADAAKGMSVYRIEEPLRLAAKIEGIYPDKWSAAAVAYTRYGCAGGSVSAIVMSDPILHPGPITIVATSGARGVASFRLPPHPRIHVIRARAISQNGACAITYSIPTAVPAEKEAGSTDTRALGVRFLSFRYSRAR